MRFLAVKGPELLSKYIGASEAGVRRRIGGKWFGFYKLSNFGSNLEMADWAFLEQDVDSYFHTCIVRI